MTEVKLPELGDGIESGDVLEVFVSVGDVISAGQDIVEMETDKATVPVPASVGGKVTKILVGEGDTVLIGGAMLEVEEVADATPVEPPTAPASDAQSDQPTSAPEPEPDPPAESEAIVAESTPTAPVEQPEPVAASAASSPTEPEPPAPAVQPVAASSQAVIAAGPAVRRFAREVGVDLSRVQGSGDHGRITREDVLSVVRSAGKSAQAAPVAKADMPSSKPTGGPVVRTSGHARKRRLRTDTHGKDEQDSQDDCETNACELDQHSTCDQL